MSIATAGLYEVKLYHTIGANELLNVFWYSHLTNDDGLAQECWDAFDEDIMPLLADAQHTSVSYTNLVVTPVFSEALEVSGQPTTTSGEQVGTLLPAFMVASIRLNRSDRSLRNGWKRFSGITEDVVTSPGFTATYLTNLNTLGTALATNISEGTETFVPQIVRRPFSTDENSPNWESINVLSATVPNRVTSQNSRKTF